MSGHKHKWKGTMFSDGCHFYQNTFQCSCGAQLSISGERQFRERGRFTASVMMANEDGTCTRCSELMNPGGRRKPTQILYWAPWMGKESKRLTRAKLKEISC